MITTPEGYDKQRERNRKAVFENRLWAKERGLCSKCCKEPTIKGRALCWRCMMNEHDRKAVIYHAHKEKGLCPICGVRNPESGNVICEECKAYNRRYQRSRYYGRKERGECVACGKKLPQNHPHVRCSACHIKDLIKHRKQAA